MSSTESDLERYGSIAQRVAAGARWLDELFGPQWVDRIDLNTLDLASTYRCICGQVFNQQHHADNVDERPGYRFAQEHLFAEANSWISRLVGEVVPLPEEFPDRTDDAAIAAYHDAYERHVARVQEVAVALGFNERNGFYTSLQDEWRKLLVARKLVAQDA